MSAGEAVAPRQTRLSAALLGGAFLLVAAAVFYWTNHPLNFFWDANCYRKGLEYWHGGGNPYLRDQNPATRVLGSFFVYPPIFLFAFGWLAAFPGSMVGVYVALYLIGLYLLLQTGFELMKAAGMSAWPVVPLLLFFPDFEQGHHLLSGNMSVPTYGAVLFLAWRAFQGWSWTPFYVVLFLAACIKGPLLALAIVPVFLDWRQIYGATATVVATLAVYAAQFKLLPALFHEYLVSLRMELVLNNDTGYSLPGLATHLSLAHRFPLLPQFIALATACLLVAACWLLRQTSAGELRPVVWFCFAWFSAVMLNPRMQPYDAPAGFWPEMVLIGLFLHKQLPRAVLAAGVVGFLVYAFRGHASSGKCLLIWCTYLAAVAWIWPMRLGATRRHEPAL